MAEGWCNHLKSDQFAALSAGIKKHGLNRLAIKVMAEAGVDISSQNSKQIADLVSHDFDHVITVCDQAVENCPYFPAKTKVIHCGFDDPPTIAAGAKSEEEALAHYRRVRDEIREFIEQLPNNLS